MSRLNFQIEATAPGSQARAGRFRTLHNEVLTPLFMPVGTLATVRAQKTETLFDSGSQILLANTYHLIQRPGLDVMETFGGIHDLMKWKRSVLTDSGGYQIFSLAAQRQMTEAGAWFRSAVDGAKIHLTPESSIAAQKSIGSDIMMVLDECIPSTSAKEVAVQAMQLTHRWAKRSLEARGDSPQALFGIVQGACYEDLRQESAETLREMPFDGFAIGGLAVGEGREERERMTAATTAHMPKHLPRYLMGVGTPIDLLEAVNSGVDMFDCILPTAFAQQGMVFTSRGRMIIRRGIYRLQRGPLDPDCSCPTCATYERGYLHHLIKSREILGWQLVGQHNLYFYHRLMTSMRAAILDGTFAAFYQKWRTILPADDQEFPINRPVRKKPIRQDPPKVRGDYQVVTSPKGHSSIQQISSQETMHSISDPIDEARRLYVDQVGLLKKSKGTSEDTPLVIWDVGLGAATNAMAVISALESRFSPGVPAGTSPKAASKASGMRPVRIVSFEIDLDSFRLALSHPSLFPYLRHSAPHAIARGMGETDVPATWESPQLPLVWDVIPGDFLQQLEAAPSPDIVLFDPFSAKVDSPLWSRETFTRLFDKCQERGESGFTELYTYSASTAVRGALLAAGFFVARGAATPPKAETTIALTHPRPEYALLGREWLDRWERSNARRAEWDASLLAHRQFAQAVSGVSPVV